MHARLRLIFAATALGLSAVVLIPAVASAAAAPSCATVSPAVVKATLGGSPGSPSTQSPSTNTFYGYTDTQLTCSYSTTAMIYYNSPATTTAFNAALKVLTGAAGVKTVSGVGSMAFGGTGTNTVGSYNAKTKKTTTTTVTTTNLWVLVTGKSFFEISASGASLAQEEALAKKMVPLV